MPNKWIRITSLAGGSLYYRPTEQIPVLVSDGVVTEKLAREIVVDERTFFLPSELERIDVKEQLKKSKRYTDAWKIITRDDAPLVSYLLKQSPFVQDKKTKAKKVEAIRNAMLQYYGNEAHLPSRETIGDWLDGKWIRPQDINHLYALGQVNPEIAKLPYDVDYLRAYRIYRVYSSAVPILLRKRLKPDSGQDMRRQRKGTDRIKVADEMAEVFVDVVIKTVGSEGYISTIASVEEVDDPKSVLKLSRSQRNALESRLGAKNKDAPQIIHDALALSVFAVAEYLSLYTRDFLHQVMTDGTVALDVYPEALYSPILYRYFYETQPFALSWRYNWIANEQQFSPEERAEIGEVYTKFVTKVEDELDIDRFYGLERGTSSRFMNSVRRLRYAAPRIFWEYDNLATLQIILTTYQLKRTGLQYQDMAMDLKEFGIVADDVPAAKSRVDERLDDIQKILGRKRVDIQKVHEIDDRRDVAIAYGLSPLLDAYDLKRASAAYNKNMLET